MKRFAYYWMAMKWFWKHRNEKSCRQKMRRFEKECRC